VKAKIMASIAKDSSAIFLVVCGAINALLSKTGKSYLCTQTPHP
jgi:hypothetical protein